MNLVFFHNVWRKQWHFLLFPWINDESNKAQEVIVREHNVLPDCMSGYQLFTLLINAREASPFQRLFFWMRDFNYPPYKGIGWAQKITLNS